MSIGLAKTTATIGIEVFQLVIETAQGGFTLDEAVLPVGSLIRAGTLMGADEATRKAMPFKGGVLQAAALNTDVTYKVLKGSNVAVGQSVNLPGGTAKTISAVDTTNANYDLITVPTTIGVAAAAGIGLFVNDNGNSKSIGLLMNDVEVPAAGITESVSIVIRGTVYERRIPPVSAAQKALIPSVLFSQSF